MTIWKKKYVPILGFLFFLIGISGVVHYYWSVRQERLDDFFSADVAAFFEVTVDRSLGKKLETLFPDTEWEKFLEVLPGDVAKLSWKDDIASWIGDKVGVGFFEDGTFLMAFEFRNKSVSDSFLEKFKLDGERFVIKKIKEGEIWTPSFSSKLSFGFHGRWLLIASSGEVIEKTFANSEKLKKVTKYKKLKQDIDEDSLMTIFLDSEKTLNLLATSQKMVVLKPLLETIVQVFPGAGISLDVEDQGISLNGTFLAQEGVLSTHAPQQPAQLMPELAPFASSDILFFINGLDFYEKYAHTKSFLSSINPQFSLLFEGILRAKFQELFGEEVDFEEAFLSLMHGQYTLLADFRNDLYPFLEFTLITEFGDGSGEEILSTMHEMVRSAQSHFTTEVEEVRLPDGTIRKELVSVDKDSVTIEEVPVGENVYFTVSSDTEGTKFSYSFVDKYLVFSTHEEGIKSVLSNKNKLQPNLSENNDFRESIIFRYPPSESYGFVNIAKLTSALEFVSEKPLSWGDFLKNNVRTATFARRVLPESIFIDLFLFVR